MNGIYRVVESIRCPRCRALLFKAEATAIAATIEIKCRRCGTLAMLKPVRLFPSTKECTSEEIT